jgi:hypothetical protein
VDGETVDGQMRLRPTGVSSLGDSATDTPAGVAGQVWQNDEDLLGGALNKTLTASQVALETGELVYGVEYQIDIYGVAGYQPFVGTYVAGIDADKTFSLTPENADPLSLISSTKDTCKTISDQTSMTEEAVVEMVFNYEVGSADSNNAEVLDDNFTLSPSSGITFKSDDSPDIQERGTQLEFDGVKLVFSFVPGKGIATPGMDPVTSAQYQSLDNFFVQRKGKPTTKTDLASLVGSTTIVCDN